MARFDADLIDYAIHFKSRPTKFDRWRLVSAIKFDSQSNTDGISRTGVVTLRVDSPRSIQGRSTSACVEDVIDARLRYDQDVILCPTCSAALPVGKAKYCPRCGTALPGAVVSSTPETAIPGRTYAKTPVTLPPHKRPIRIEQRGSLLNPFFLGSATIVLAGALLAGEGQLRFGTILLALGLPSLLIFTIRSLVR